MVQPIELFGEFVKPLPVSRYISSREPSLGADWENDLGIPFPPTMTAKMNKAENANSIVISVDIYVPSQILDAV